MSERTLNSKLHVIDGLKIFYNKKPENFVVSNALILAAKLAHASYMNWMDQERKKEKETEKRLLEKNRERNHILAVKSIERAEMKVLEEKLQKEKQVEQQKLAALDKILNIAQDTIVSATKRDGSIAYEDAQALKVLISGANELKKDQTKQTKTLSVIEEEVSKKKILHNNTDCVV